MAENFKNTSENADCRLSRLGELDLLLVRMELLAPADRILLEMRFEHNMSFQKIATFTGIGPTTVTYRIRRMVRRLLSDDYITILRAKDNFTQQELEISYDYFILGLGYRAIAAKRKISRSTVRRSANRMNIWIKKGAEDSE